MNTIIKRTIITLSMVGLLIFGVGQVKGEAKQVLKPNMNGKGGFVWVDGGWVDPD